jgi:hypothetical protein
MVLGVMAFNPRGGGGGDGRGEREKRRRLSD